MSLKLHCSSTIVFGESDQGDLVGDKVDDGTRARELPHPGNADAGGPPLFNLNRMKHGDKGDSNGRPAEPRLLDRPYKIVRCKCRCRFCSDCALGLGLKLKEKLIPTIAKWSSMVMVTLTINPQRFGSPEEAYRFVTKNRLISRWVRELTRRGVLKSRKFFSVFECQKNGNPHWHLLLEAPFVDHAVAMEIWNRFGTATNGTPKNPATGFVWFSAPKFKTPEHAANYACKYIIKPPAEGWPDWVLDYVGQVRRVSRSQRLFDHLKEPEKTPDYCHCGTCFCSSCREQTPPSFGCECTDCEDARQAIEELPEREKPEAAERKSRTVRERLKACGSNTIVLKRMAAEVRPGQHQCQFITSLNIPFDQACIDMGEKPCSQLFLNQKQLDQLFSDDRMRNREEADFEWIP